MARWLSIDHGRRRIGVAVGSTDDGVVSPLAVLPAEPAGKVPEAISALVEKYGVKGVVVGWPLNMDDTEGPQALQAREFAKQLIRTTGLDVRLWDERLSSFAADQVLAGAMTRKKKKARQDAVAAAAILEDFIRRDGPASAVRPDQTGPLPPPKAD